MDSQYQNVFDDTVIAWEQVTARLFGKVRNDIIVKEGATVYLHGKGFLEKL